MLRLRALGLLNCVTSTGTPFSFGRVPSIRESHIVSLCSAVDNVPTQMAVISLSVAILALWIRARLWFMRETNKFFDKRGRLVFLELVLLYAEQMIGD
jgi:hypothetical protein